MKQVLSPPRPQLILSASSWLENEGSWYSTLTATVTNMATEKSYRLALGGEGGAPASLPSVAINGVLMNDESEETFFISNVGGDLPTLRRNEAITVSLRLLLQEQANEPAGVAELFDAGSGEIVAVATIPLPTFEGIYARRECEESAEERTDELRCGDGPESPGFAMFSDVEKPDQARQTLEIIREIGREKEALDENSLHRS